MNPYYRCYAASDGFVAVACLNLAQREAFLALFGLDDATVAAPDVVPTSEEVLAAKRRVTSEIESRIASDPASAWLERLASAGVPCGPVLVRESVLDDEQVRASGLVTEVSQPALGQVRMLGSLVGRPASAPAPELGADTEAVLAAIA
jgi:crotonobetainyl-CoA:carnitine CoA-transferase CaiB-like acyl-CoA transferase